MHEIDGLDGFKRRLGTALGSAAFVPAVGASPTIGARTRIVTRRIAVAVVVAVAAGLAVAVSLGAFAGRGVPAPRAVVGVVPGNRTRAPSGVAAILLTAARAPALRAADRSLGPHRYWYERMRITEPGLFGHGALITSTQTYWMARDGSGRQQVSAARTRTGRREGAPKALVVHGRRRPFYLGLGRMSYRQLRSLPTTTTGLAHRVRVIARRQVGRQHRLPRTADLYRYTAFALLRDAYENPTTSALRAAVWRLLARTPGLRLNGRVTDDAGRPGIAVSQVIGPVRFRIVVDPARGRLLEYDRYLVRREGTEPPGLIWRAVFLASGVVDSDGARAERRVRTP